VHAPALRRTRRPSSGLPRGAALLLLALPTVRGVLAAHRGEYCALARRRHLYGYPPEKVEEIAERARVLADEAREVDVMFNDNARDYASKPVRRMLQALGQRSA